MSTHDSNTDAHDKRRLEDAGASLPHDSSPDGDLDALLRQVFASERMPEGLAASTMNRIRAERAARTARTDRATRGRRRMGRRQFVTLMAACLAAGALAASGAVAFAGETARVEVGAHVSVTLGLNRWSRVVRVAASDAALQNQLDSLDLIGLSCEDAVTRIASDSALQQDLADEGTLVIAVTSDSAFQQDAVLGQCQAATKACGARAACMAADEQTVAAARQAGMGVARYQVYEQIAELDPSVTLEQCQGMRMRQLRALLAEKQAEAAASNTEAPGSGGGNYGTAGSAHNDSSTVNSPASGLASSAHDTSAGSGTRGHGMMGAGHGDMGGGSGMGMGRGGGHGMGSGMGRHADAAE